MDNILLRILLDSYERRQKAEPGTGKNGPFVTISRDYGCQANVLAEMLARAIAAKGSHWKVMNKEVILEAAKELNVDPEKVRQVEGSLERGTLDEVLSSLTTKYYKSDRKVRQTIASVVTAAAESGNVIIVGRGGAAITQGMPKAVHIKLTAPVQWRLDNLISRHNLKREDTVKTLASIDHKRYKMLRDYMKGSQDLNELYDVVINCSKVSHYESVEMIMEMLESRGLV
ncbi:MAG TPA: cytidylate kinase-like family protein [Lentimicrobium sp.]|jgi:cytidylate kinase|nr:cytidylate kinase-like family protein [Lentimicrobium sp.]